MIAHTFTRPGALCPFTARTWPENGDWLDAARATSLEHLPVWIAPELWRVELEGHVATPAAQLLAERGRLVEQVDAWDRRTAEAFVAGCIGRTIERAISKGAGGEGAVVRMLEIVANEIVGAMTLLGVTRLAELNSHYLTPAEPIARTWLESAFPLMREGYGAPASEIRELSLALPGAVAAQRGKTRHS